MSITKTALATTGRDDYVSVMRKARNRKRLSRTTTGDNPLADDGRPAGAPLPPLTTTLKSFVKGGSDRELRKLVYTIVSLGNQMARHRKLCADHIGVSEAQAIMLRMIAESQDATVGQLAQQLQVTSQFVTIEIGDLVRKGIVEKRPNKADRRSVLLRLTAKGEGLVRELSTIMRIGNDIWLRSLSEDRAKMLQDTLSTLLIHGIEASHAISAPSLRNRVV
ncbi:MAG: MarR family winged helix-turn-helix transcriptional regulator [Xanthobacteraceae bacterium]